MKIVNKTGEEVYQYLRIQDILPSMDAVNKRIFCETVDNAIWLAQSQQPVPEADQGKLSIEQILNALSKVDYPAWGHGMMQMWFYNDKWRVGLRNYKIEPIRDNPSVFSSVSPYAALASLYNFCVEMGHLTPNH